MTESISNLIQQLDSTFTEMQNKIKISENVNEAQTDLLFEISKTVGELRESILQLDSDNSEVDNWQEKAIDDCGSAIEALSKVAMTDEDKVAYENRFTDIQNTIASLVNGKSSEDELQDIKLSELDNKILELDCELNEAKINAIKIDQVQDNDIKNLINEDKKIYDIIKLLKKDVDKNTLFRKEYAQGNGLDPYSGRDTFSSFLFSFSKELARLVITIMIIYFIMR